MSQSLGEKRRQTGLKLSMGAVHVRVKWDTGPNKCPGMAMPSVPAVGTAVRVVSCRVCQTWIVCGATFDPAAPFGSDRRRKCRPFLAGPARAVADDGCGANGARAGRNVGKHPACRTGRHGRPKATRYGTLVMSFAPALDLWRDLTPCGSLWV